MWRTVLLVALAIAGVLILGNVLLSYLQYAVGAVVIAAVCGAGLWLLLRFLIGGKTKTLDARPQAVRREEQQAQRELKQMERTQAATKTDEAQVVTRRGR